MIRQRSTIYSSCWDMSRTNRDFFEAGVAAVCPKRRLALELLAPSLGICRPACPLGLPEYQCFCKANASTKQHRFAVFESSRASPEVEASRYLLLGNWVGGAPPFVPTSLTVRRVSFVGSFPSKPLGMLIDGWSKGPCS